MKSTQTQSLRPAEPGPDGSAGPALVMAWCCTHPLTLPARVSLIDCDDVLLGRGPARALQRVRNDGKSSLVVREPDACMSSSHARLEHRDGSWSIVDTESKNGTFVDGQRIARSALRDGSLVRTGGATWIFREHIRVAAGESANLDLAAHPAIDGFTTLNTDLAETFASLRRIATSKLSVLLSGPTGSGKEVVASEIHRASGRSGAFVSVNCGAIPSGLVEATLLGSRKGSFSNATENRAGMVRTSDRGTLFLDEIGELPLPAQTALLRVLQEREVVAVGADTPTSVDLRVIAASHRDLEQMVIEGSFREDLLARLTGHCVDLPPLHARREDLGLLCARLLGEMDEVDVGRTAITVEAATVLFDYAWPRNVRELAQTLARAVALTEGGTIDVAHLPDKVRAPASAVRTADDASVSRLVDLLALHRGNLSAIARDLSTSRSQVRRLLARYDIQPASYTRS